jgi:hypothetical protein
MGGINSGRRRSIHRGTVEQFPAIDLRILRRAGLLRPGECTYDTLRWQDQAPEALSSRIFIDLSDIGDASMRIISAGGAGTINQRVAIECVPCPYGGVRCYFLCPVNGIRCQQLFLADGQFASRKAHRLTYASQSEDDLSRIRRKAHRLRRRVEGDACHPRPRGRNRWHKMQQLRVAEFDARALYLDRLRGLVGDIL